MMTEHESLTRAVHAANIERDANWEANASGQVSDLLQSARAEIRELRAARNRINDRLRELVHAEETLKQAENVFARRLGFDASPEMEPEDDDA